MNLFLSGYKEKFQDNQGIAGFDCLIDQTGFWILIAIPIFPFQSKSKILKLIYQDINIS